MAKTYGKLELNDKILLANRRKHHSIYKEGIETLVPRAIVMEECVSFTTGEVLTAVYVITENGECYSSISQVVAEFLGKIIDVLSEEGNAKITCLHFTHEKSAKGRDYLACTADLEEGFNG